MSRVVFSPTALVVRGCQVDDYSLGASAVDEVLGNPAVTPVIVKDRLTNRTTTASDLLQTFSISPAAALGDTVSVVNTTPSVCSIGTDGVLDIVGAGGQCVLKLTSGKGSAHYERRYSAQVLVKTAPFVDTPQPLSGEPGSLRRHLWEQILAAINGRTPGIAAQDIHTNVVLGATPAATANPNRILSGLDFSHTAFQKRSPTIPFIESKSPCHLISPRHVLGSFHVGPQTYKELWFRRPDGSFQYVQVTNVENWNGVSSNPVGYEYVRADACVMYLSEPVTGIAPMKFIPANYMEKLPDFYVGASDLDANLNLKPSYPLPFLASYWRDGEGASTIPLYSESRHLRPSVLAKVLGTVGADLVSVPLVWPLPQTYSELNACTANPQGGDSCSILYMLVNGQIGCFGMVSNLTLPHALPNLTAMMNKLAVDNGEVNPNYAPQVLDLSMFPSYQ